MGGAAASILGGIPALEIQILRAWDFVLSLEALLIQHRVWVQRRALHTDAFSSNTKHFWVKQTRGAPRGDVAAIKPFSAK